MPDSLLDDWMPADTAAVRARHAIRIAAPPDVVHRAVWSTEFGGVLPRTLLLVRLVPAVLARWWRGTPAVRAPRARLTLARFTATGFTRLAEVVPDEIVLGLTGRFWTPSGGLERTEALTFRAGPAPGLAQAAWNFHVHPLADGTTELSTETRVRVAADAAPAFRRYWRVVGIGSGWLRVAMLRAVRRTAERAARTGCWIACALAVATQSSDPRAFDVGVVPKDDQSQVVEDCRMWATQPRTRWIGVGNCTGPLSGPSMPQRSTES